MVLRESDYERAYNPIPTRCFQGSRSGLEIMYFLNGTQQLQIILGTDALDGDVLLLLCVFQRINESRGPTSLIKTRDGTN